MSTHPIPGSHTDDREKCKRPRPPSGLRGWAGAWSVLERVRSDADCELLSWLTRKSGFQGPALKHFAQCALWEAGLGDYKGAPEGLKQSDSLLVQARACDAVAAVAGRFPQARAHRNGSGSA